MGYICSECEHTQEHDGVCDFCGKPVQPLDEMTEENERKKSLEELYKTTGWI